MLIAFTPANPSVPSAQLAAPEVLVQTSCLGGPPYERLIGPSQSRAVHGCVHMFRTGAFTTAYAQLEVSADPLRSQAKRAYADLFAALKGHYLYRIWNYVPDINAGEGDGENYRQFCLGRSEAFEDEYGAFVTSYIPAGSCVGCEGNQLIVVVAAGSETPDHFENPKQLPAYQYPREYGPRSPSFARASSVRIGDRRYRFISGTAAVLGHASVGEDNLQEQLAVTCDNLEAIVEETLAAPAATGRPVSAGPVSGKVYLRHAADLSLASDFLKQRLPKWSNNLTYLRSDICRRELLVEIELNFIDQIHSPTTHSSRSA